MPRVPLSISIAAGFAWIAVVTAGAQSAQSPNGASERVPTRIVPPISARRIDAVERLDRVSVVEPLGPLVRQDTSCSRTTDLFGSGDLWASPWGAPHFGYSWGWYAPNRALLDAYRAGRREARRIEAQRYNQDDMQRRAQRALTRHEQALSEGLEWLREGDALRAARQFELAAQLNQGDPACRIHLAQARLALGHFDESATALRRAFELQPRLIYLDLHWENDFESPEALDRCTEQLVEHMRRNPTSADVHLLRGYLEVQRGRLAAAQAAFSRVAQVMPEDDVTRAFLSISKPVAP